MEAGKVIGAVSFAIGGTIGGVVSTLVGKNKEIQILKAQLYELTELKNQLENQSEERRSELEELNKTINLLQDENNLRGSNISELSELQSKVAELSNLLESVSKAKEKSEEEYQAELDRLEKQSQVVRLNFEEIMSSISDSSTRTETQLESLQEQTARIEQRLDDEKIRNETQFNGMLTCLQGGIEHLNRMDQISLQNAAIFQGFMQMQQNLTDSFIQHVSNDNQQSINRTRNTSHRPRSRRNIAFNSRPRLTNTTSAQGRNNINPAPSNLLTGAQELISSPVNHNLTSGSSSTTQNKNFGKFA